MTPAHDALLNHACTIGVTCCRPSAGRYCETGRELWLQYRAECVATGWRDAMLTVRHQSPEWAEEIKRRALILMGENNNQRRAA